MKNNFQFIDISKTDVNRIICENGNIGKIVYSKDKELTIQKDGENAFNEIYSENSTKYAKLSQLANSQNPDTQRNIKGSIRELGKSIVAIRNATFHTTDRKCYNETISKENSKRFLVVVDLFLEMDKLFYTN